MRNLLILSLLIPFTSIFAADVTLDASYFKNLDWNKLPIVQKIKMSKLGADIQLSQFNGQFSPFFNMMTYYGEDKSRQLNRFVPVTSPTKLGKLGFSKNTSYGISFEGNIFAEQFSNNFLRRSTTVGGEFNLGIDLYKDIFGRSSRKRLMNAQDLVKLKTIEVDIFTHQAKTNILKMYWALVANNEAIKITKTLIGQAKRQVEITAQRVKNSVSDKGTLARMRSILSSREGSLNALYYQRSNIHRGLRELIPEFKGQELTLGDYNIDNTISELFQCTNMLESSSYRPVENSMLDEVSVIQSEIAKREELLAKVYDDVNLQLKINSKLVGKDFSYSEGMDDLSSDARPVANVSLVFSAPLGGSFKESSNSMREISKLKGQTALEEVSLKLNAQHTEILNSIRVLKSALKNQSDNANSLKQSLDSSRQKFNQARINIEQLVGEEDAYFFSELNNISANLNIIHTVIDYFSVFTQTNCSLNLQ